MPASPVRDVLAFHGWGFDAGFWRPWERMFGSETRFQAADRGYFGTRRDVAWPPGSPSGDRILLTHSMGLMFPSRDVLREADLVILFGAFQSFLPVSVEERRRARRILQRMRSRLGDAPMNVIDSFHQNCGLPAGTEVHAREDRPGTEGPRLNVDRLTRDLDRLEHGRVDVEALGTVPRILAVHGGRDRIVPVNAARMLAEALRVPAPFLEIPDAGHAVPVTHAGECWQFISPVLAGS